MTQTQQIQRENLTIYVVTLTGLMVQEKFAPTLAQQVVDVTGIIAKNYPVVSGKGVVLAKSFLAKLEEHSDISDFEIIYSDEVGLSIVSNKPNFINKLKAAGDDDKTALIMDRILAEEENDEYQTLSTNITQDTFQK